MASAASIPPEDRWALIDRAAAPQGHRMRSLLGAAFATAQYLCNITGVVLTAYLLYEWNAERTLDPAFDGFNPWWPGLIAFALGVVFKFARKGVAVDIGAQKPSGDI